MSQFGSSDTIITQKREKLCRKIATQAFLQLLRNQFLTCQYQHRVLGVGKNFTFHKQKKKNFHKCCFLSSHWGADSSSERSLSILNYLSIQNRFELRNFMHRIFFYFSFLIKPILFLLICFLFHRCYVLHRILNQA